MKGTRRLALGMLPVLVLAGCYYLPPAIDETVLARDMDYECAGGRSMRVVRAADAQSAQVVFDSRVFDLRRQPSAVQERFSDGTITLVLHGDEAGLAEGNRVVAGPCRSVVPLPTAPRSRR